MEKEFSVAEEFFDKQFWMLFVVIHTKFSLVFFGI